MTTEEDPTNLPLRSSPLNGGTVLAIVLVVDGF